MNMGEGGGVWGREWVSESRGSYVQIQLKRSVPSEPVRGYLTGVLTALSLMVSDFKHLFMCHSSGLSK